MDYLILAAVAAGAITTVFFAFHFIVRPQDFLEDERKKKEGKEDEGESNGTEA